MQLNLFSSNARTLYLQDAINALVQPEGSVIHLRYEENYVAEYLKQNMPAVGTQTLIYLADAQRQAEPQAIYPLRHGTLAGIERYEGVIHFWVRLGPYPAVNSREIYNAAVATAVARLGSDLPSNNIHAVLKSPFTFGDANNYQAFPTIVSAISEYCLDANRLAFVRITGVERIEGKRLVNEGPVETLVASGLPPFPQYVWKPGKTYVVSLSWHTPAGHTLRGTDDLPLQLNFEHDEDLLSVSGPHSMLINGRYDREYLLITVRKPSKTTRTNLTIRVVQQNDEAPPHTPPNQGVLGVYYQMPVEIPVDDRLAGRYLLVGDVLTTIGPSLLAAAALFIRFFPQGTSTPTATLEIPLWLLVAVILAILMIFFGIFCKYHGNKLKE